MGYFFGDFCHLREIKVWRRLFGMKSSFILCYEENITVVTRRKILGSEAA